MDSHAEGLQGALPAHLLKGRTALVTSANSGIGKATDDDGFNARGRQLTRVTR
ncbi:hypothetical protein [Streptomyces sp. BE230]|uniref:hypothetical protein n=1 Tax=Streptomyces sp. BE230 TaxID=3002526 RepID=UPI002ED50135|nr:hypothetical protein [Streptomyces sp. BE230]